MLNYSKEWQQENISVLVQDITGLIPSIKLIESILGADRESFRLEWQHQQYLLNFDVYSQSIWLEAMGHQEQSLFNQIIETLK